MTPSLARLVVVGTAILLVGGCHSRDPNGNSTAPDRSNPSLPSSITQRTPWFAEEAQQRGVNFTWKSGHQRDNIRNTLRAGRPNYLLPEIVGGGVALLDIDNDGDLDLYFVQGGSLTASAADQPPNALFRNRGNGTFEDITHGSGADDRHYGMGVACGDYDNDGDVDLFVTNVGPNVLLRNDSLGHFTDITAMAGVAGNASCSSSAAFLDYDSDGDLDLFVCHYVNWSVAAEVECHNPMGLPDYCQPTNYSAPTIDALYRNNGDGTFTDVTAAAGIDAHAGTGLGVVCGDFTGDGRIDIFVANDGMRNFLWINQGDGRFIESALPLGCALDDEGRAKAGMGVDADDIDDDGDLDLIVCNLVRESDSFFRNEGAYFLDATAQAGLRITTRLFTRFGLGWVDFNNDGHLDLFEASGLVARLDLTEAGDPYAQPNLLFRGSAGGQMTEVQPRGGTDPLLVHTSRGAAFGDIDNDGRVDVVVVNRDGPAYVLRNVATPEHPDGAHWIMLRVLDEHNRDAYGATITFKLDNRTIKRDVRAAYSYMASNDPRVHVGLGSFDHAADVHVQWIDGTVESFGNLAADRIHTLKRRAPEP